MIRIVGPDEAACAALAKALIAGLTGRGLEVSIIARSRSARALDRPGKDSRAHRDAGARAVAVVSPERWAIIHDRSEPEAEPALVKLVNELAPVALVLALGYDEGPGEVIELGADGSVHAGERRYQPDALEDLCARLSRAP